MSTRKDQLLRRAAGNNKSRAVALTREEKALRAFLEQAKQGHAQPDLSQNDETAPDYVKGRTHYSRKYSDYTWINSDAHTFESAGAYFDTFVGYHFTEGETYYVNWGGVEYECITYVDGDGYPYIGNKKVAEITGWEWNFIENSESSEPFFIYTYKHLSHIFAEVISAKAGTFSVKLGTVQEEIHTLDEKYIPDTIARKADIIGAMEASY